jgi:hypothetical protein
MTPIERVYVLVRVSLNGEDESRSNVGVFATEYKAWKYENTIPVMANVWHEVESYGIDENKPEDNAGKEKGVVRIWPPVQKFRSVFGEG